MLGKKRLSGVLLVTTLFMLVLLPSVFAISAARTFSNANPAPGEVIGVTLTVSAPISTAYGVVENVPTGFAISAQDNDGGVSSQRISWVFMDATARTLHYNVAVPSTPGTYTFSGVYSDGTTAETPITGPTTITVSAGSNSTVPPVISSLAAAPKNTSATISWTTDKQSTSTLYYGTVSPPTGSFNDAVLRTSHSLTLNGLTAQTTYYYRVRACDASSNCANSAIQSFTTGGSIPPPPQVNITDDLNVNYVRGILKFNGVPAQAGTEYSITMMNGPNQGQSYTSRVDSNNIPVFMRGNGYFDTGDQVIFNSGMQFRLNGFNGYVCSNPYTGVFQNGGNGNFEDQGAIVIFECQYVQKHAPRIDSMSPSSTSVTLAEGSSQAFSATASDEDNDLPLTYSYYLDGTLVSTTNSYTYAPGYGASGNHRLTLTVRDSTLMFANVTWNIVVSDTNRKPVLTPIGPLSATQGQPFTYTVSATDPDGEVVTYSINSGNTANIPINRNTGVISFTPTNAQVGTYSITITATDSRGLSSDPETITFTITNVNDAPVLSPIGNKQAFENVLFDKIKLSATDPDGPSDTLQYQLMNGPAGMSVDPATGQVLWTPAIESKGDYQATFRVTDTSDAFDEEAITINVKPVIEIVSAVMTVDGNTSIVKTGSTIRTKANSDVRYTITIRDNADTDLFGVNISYSIPGVPMSGSMIISQIAKGSTQMRTIDTKVPLIVNTGAYPMTIRADDMNDAHEEFFDVITANMNLDKENNELLIEKADFLTNPMVCSVGNQLNISLVNTGDFDLTNVELDVRNLQLGIDSTSYIPLLRVNERNSSIYSVNIPNTKIANPVSYSVDVTAKYFFAAKSAKKTVQLIVNPCPISNIMPNPANPIYITENGQQQFSLTVPSGITVQWIVDGAPQTTGSSYTYVGDGARGRFNHNITARVQDYQTISWKLIQTSYPITDAYNGTTTDFSTWTEYELRNARGIIFDNPGVARITIPGPVDVSDIPTFNGLVKLTDVAGIDTVALPIFKPQAGTVEWFNRGYTDSPRILYSDVFTGDTSQIKSDCSFCTLTDFTPPPSNAGHISFDVTHFTVFRNIVNHMPSITSVPISTTYRSRAYAYDVNAVDADANTLTYSLTAAPNGMAINANSGLISWTPASLGNYNVAILVSDGFGGNVTQSYVLQVTEAPKLIIDNFEVKVGSKSEDVSNGDTISKDAKPGDSLRFKIKVCNDYTDEEGVKINNVGAKVTIRSIDGGDDIEESSEDVNIDAGACKTLNVNADVPSDAEEDTYNIDVVVEGKDARRSTQKVVWNLALDVKREKHLIKILSTRLNPTKIAAGKDAILDVSVENIGQDPEDKAAVRVEAPDLGIDMTDKSLQLDNSMGSQDSMFSKTYRIRVNGDVAPGSYPIRVTTYYDDTQMSQTSTVNIEVTEAVTKTTQEEEQPQAPPATTTTEQTQQPTIDTSGLSPMIAEPIVTRSSWIGDDEYLTLLIIIVVINIGIIGFILELLLFKRWR